MSLPKRSILYLRRSLQNVYCGAGDELGDSELPQVESEIRRNRLQRLFAEHSGGTTLANVKESFVGGSASNAEIERIVRILHRAIRSSLIEEGIAVDDPFLITDPLTAIKMLGFEVESLGSLGQFLADGRTFEVAGLVDQELRRVEYSSRFPRNWQRFTQAHELGHITLHPQDRVHRDRPIDGSGGRKNRVEWQADRFAVYFLMPMRLVIKEFVARFATDSIELSEATAFALLGETLMQARGRFPTRRDLAHALASASSFDGRQFMSLASRFNVSEQTMAIRLEELELVHL